MKFMPVTRLLRNSLCIFIIMAAMVSCGAGSSPEGRMTMKIEQLQKAMADSLLQQNRAILDSLGKIREELNEIKQQRK